MKPRKLFEAFQYVTRLKGLFLICILIGCTHTIGKEFDPNDVRYMTPGVSTYKDAVRIFGQPAGEAFSADGSRRQVVWQYARGTSFGGSEARRLVLLFDKNDVYIRMVGKAQVGEPQPMAPVGERGYR